MYTISLDFGDTELETLVDIFKPVLETSGIHAERIPDQWTEGADVTRAPVPVEASIAECERGG